MTTKKRPSRTTKVPTVKAVREAAFESADMGEAASRLAVADMEQVLKRSKKLSAAWGRGRFLRQVKAVARESFRCIAAADKPLGLAPGAFERIYATDRIARDLWDSQRFELKMALERAWIQRAHDGDAKAAALVEHFFVDQAPKEPVDFERLSPAEAAKATGIDHRQLLRWHKSHDLPRNADGSYNLPKLVAWLREWELKKLSAQKAGTPIGLNPLQARKVEKLEMDLAQKRHQLLPRDEVIAGIAMRYQRLARAKRRVAELAMAVHGESTQRCEQLIETFIDELCDKQIEAYGELKLPPEAEPTFAKLLEQLEPDGEIDE